MFCRIVGAGTDGPWGSEIVTCGQVGAVEAGTVKAVCTLQAVATPQEELFCVGDWVLTQVAQKGCGVCAWSYSEASRMWSLTTGSGCPWLEQGLSWMTSRRSFQPQPFGDSEIPTNLIFCLGSWWIGAWQNLLSLYQDQISLSNLRPHLDLCSGPCLHIIWSNWWPSASATPNHVNMPMQHVTMHSISFLLNMLRLVITKACV